MTTRIEAIKGRSDVYKSEALRFTGNGLWYAAKDAAPADRSFLLRLLPYVKHDDDCDGWLASPCSCGLSALMEETE